MDYLNKQENYFPHQFTVDETCLCLPSNVTLSIPILIFYNTVAFTAPYQTSTAVKSQVF